jgi:PAS domain S-box-containing protein
MIEEQKKRSFALTEKLFAIGFIAALITLPLVVLMTIREANRVQMHKHTEEISSAISSLRTYYSENIVKKLQESNGQAIFTENYKNVHGGIPIPATFSIEMANLFDSTHNDTALEYAFISDYPFKSRNREKLSNFQTKAIAAFRADPKLRFFDEEHAPLYGEAYQRLATPVVMQAACVACHNNHPDSIKTDWKVGDIRGIQEVSVKSISSSLDAYRYLFYYFGLVSILALGSVGAFRRTALNLSAANKELEIARTRDLANAKELKKQLGQLALLGAVADKSTFGITIADAKHPDCPLVYANDAFYTLTGLAPEDVIGHNCRFLKGKKTSQEALSGIRQAIKKGLPHTTELLNYKKNGESFWNRLTLFPVGGTEGKPDFYVGYQVNVTSLRDAEAERNLMLAEIQEAQKLESLGILVAGISHEINNPLGIAITATSHVSQSTDELRKLLSSQGVLNPDVEDFLEDEKIAFNLIQSNLERAASLVKNFKEVAADRSQDNMRVVDLKQLLESISGTFTPLMRRARCKLITDIPEHIELVLDTGSFGQLITNLVVNATVHAFDGIKNPEILIKVIEVNGSIDLTVEDNGNGIPPSALPQLFTPFFTTKRLTGGTGLGLFIAKRIAIESLNGDLVALPRSPNGTVFKLSFPIKK